jgi:hypothetical protein
LRPFLFGFEVFTVWLALAAPADPVIDAPKEEKVYVPVVVKLKDVPATTQARWTITPAPAWKENVAGKDGVGVRFTGPPGKYYVRALYVDFDNKLFGEVEGETAIVGVVPPVPPGPVPPGPNPPEPNPNPKPLPRPTSSPFAGNVYDQALLIADLQGSARLGRACEQFSKDLGTTIVDPTAVPPAFTKVIKDAALSANWKKFGDWLISELMRRAATVQQAKLVIGEVAVGLKAAGGVQ